MFKAEEEGHVIELYKGYDRGGFLRTRGPGEYWKRLDFGRFFPIKLYLGLAYLVRRDPLVDHEWHLPVQLPVQDEVVFKASRVIRDNQQMVRLRYEGTETNTSAFDICLTYEQIDDLIKEIDEGMTC